MFTMANLVALGAFLAVGLGSWGLLSALAGRRSGPGDRLDRMINSPATAAKAAGAAQRQASIQAKMAAAAAKLSGPMTPKDEAAVGKLRLKLLNAGFRGERAVATYLGMKAALVMVLLAIAVPVCVSRFGLSRTGMTYIVLAASLGMFLPGMVLGNLVKKRSMAIFLALPDALDLMVVCVEAGLGLDSAMRKVTTELTEACPVICEEFTISNFQVQMGRPRREVLRDLGIRTGVDDVRALAAVIIQAERFGSSVGSALRVLSDSMRVRRRQLAEEKAAKTAVKIMIPLILFIFPGIFVVLVGPAALQIATTMIK